MMPGESRSQVADTGPVSGVSGSGTGPGPCENCHRLQQNLNEYVTAFISLKQKIIDTDHVLTEYQKKCDELQKTERDRQTLRDQLDESLQKFVSLEKCKEEMDAMRVELKEKRSSIKMYQQSHLEFSKLEQERIKNDAMTKKLEMRIKKLEEITTKQNGEIKQLKKEKRMLEGNLKKSQEKLLVQQKRDVKVLKYAETQNSMHEIPRIDKNKVKLLLNEIWMCIENSSVQEKPCKRSKNSPGKRANSQKKCKIRRSSLINQSHSSPLKKDLPQSSSLHQMECVQEKNDQCELDECLIEGLKSNGDSAFYDENTIKVTRHQDAVCSPSTDIDNGDDEEQDALSQQLQEILYWTQPLPPQLSPLPYLSSSGKQSIFGNITDISDDEDGNLPRRRVSGGFSETGQPDSSACTEAVTTDQSSLAEAGISESTLEQSSAEKMNCTKIETENINTQCFTETKTGDEASYPCLIAADVHCRNESNAEAQSLLAEIGRDSDMTTTPGEQSVDNHPPPNNSQGSFKALTSTDLAMENNNSIDSISHNEEGKLPPNSMLASNIKQTCIEFGVIEQSKLEKMQDIAPSGDLDCSIETDLSSFESKKYVSIEDKGIEKINFVRLISDHQKDTSIVASTLLNSTEDFVVKKQNGLDGMEGAILVTTESSIIADGIEGGSKNSVCAGDVPDCIYSNNRLVFSNQEFILENQSDLTIKEKDSLNRSEEMASLEFDGFDTSKHDVPIAGMEIDSNDSRSDSPKDECISTSVSFSSQLSKVKSATMNQDFLCKAEKRSPLVDPDSSMSQSVIIDKKDCSSTEEMGEVTSKIATPQFASISIQSSTEVSATSSVIKEEDIITKAEEISLFLVSDSSVITKLAQDNSTECTSTEKSEDIHCTQSKSTEFTKCESPVDKSKDDQLMENNKRERSEMEGIHNNTVKSSGDYLSSDQTSSHFDAFSDEFSRSNVSQNLEEQHFTHIGQNNADDASNNTPLTSEEYSYTEKNKDEHLEKPLLGNRIQQPVPKSCSPTQICKVNEVPQTHEVGVSTLIGKIKKAKHCHRKSQGPIKETQKTVHHKLDESDLTIEVVTPVNLQSELEVQASKHKTEIGQHCPSDSENVSTSNDTVCNNESISHAVEESTIILPDCIESKTEEFTLDKGYSQDPCQTPMFNVHDNTNKNDEASGNGCDMLAECEASDLENPAQKVCDNETCSESSPNNYLLDFALKHIQLAGNNSNQDDPIDMEKSESSCDIYSNQNANICTKEHFRIQMNCNRIGITELMSNCEMSVKKVNSSSNALAGSSNYMPSVQKVDNSTQTELIYNGSQVVLFTRSNWPTQTNIIREDQDGIPKAKCVSFLPDAASDHRPIISVSVHEKAELHESIIGNSVKLKSFGTSVDDQSFKTISGRKAYLNRLLPNASIDGDVQDGSSQKSKIQSTNKRRVALRRKSKGSSPNHMPVLGNTNVSTPPLCMQEIHQVMLEMGQPLPPLLPPLVATPPRTIRSTRVQSPVTTSSMPSLCSPVDDLASPSKETSKAASVSPLLDYLQQKSPPIQSPSPLDFARSERIQSSPLQFCTTTPKHAVPVPGRLPQSASASTGSNLPQENSVKILDAMYPNLSARARTLNILRGNVQLSMRGPADGENQARPVNQIMGFKAINSTPTAFVKAGSNSRSEGSAKDLEQQKLVDISTSNVMDVSKQDQRAVKRCAEDDGGSKAKKLKPENVCHHEGNIADVITQKESPTVDDVVQTKPLCSRVIEPKTTNKTKLLSQPCEPSNEDGVASALTKITQSCFDLLPVIRSHVFVGNIPLIPVLRDEEKEVICELNGNKDLMEALLLAIIKKLKVEQTTLDGNCLQALCRVYVAICRHQGDLERARLLSYSILKEDFPDSSKLLLLILSVWQNIFSLQGPINKAMQAVAKQRAKGDVMNCLSAYLNWEKNPPLDASCLVSSFFVAMQQSPKVGFQASHEHGMDFNGDMWELIYAIDLLCSQQSWAWTHDCFIRKEVWPVMDKWMKYRKGCRNVRHIQDVTVAGVMRLIGRLGQQGLKKGSATAVQNIATVINTFLQKAFQEGVPWPVQLSAAYAVYDLAPSNPKGALEALQKWNASVTEPIPTVVKNCLTELDALCERLNFEKSDPKKIASSKLLK